jgi:branched-chain amino acid transport system substrate-binding protein
MVSPSASSRCLTEASWSCGKRTTSLRPTGRNNFFRIEAADPLEGRGMGRYVVDVLKLSRIAVLNEWDYLGDLTVQEFQRELAVGNARVVLNQRLDSTTTSFAPFLEAADAAGAQAVYAIGDSTDAPFCMIARQMKEITPGMVLLGTDGIATDPQCVSDAGASNAEGVLGTFIDVDPRQSTDPGVRSIVDAYVRTHPDVSFFTFAAYDCARILIAAIDRAIKAAGGNIPTRQQVIEAVAQTNYHGLTGDYTFDANGDATSPLMSMWQVRNGVWTYVEKLDVSAS